ncbi:MAG: PaaI family thioesterase [Conexibacter sp.]
MSTTDRSEAPRVAGPCSAVDRFATELGARLLDVEVGRARVELLAQERHCNDLGTVHGGVLFSLADVALAVASNAREGEMAVAITGGIHYLRPGRPGDRLVAEAVEQHRGGRLGSYAIAIRSGEETIATAMATTLLTGRREQA